MYSRFSKSPVSSLLAPTHRSSAVLVSRSQTLYLLIPATRGGKGLAHTNGARGSGLHWKTMEEIKPHSMNLIKDGTCQNDFCASENYITDVGLASLTMSCLISELPTADLEY